MYFGSLEFSFLVTAIASEIPQLLWRLLKRRNKLIMSQLESSPLYLAEVRSIFMEFYTL